MAKKINAEEFDRMFDAGEDMSEYIDFSTATRFNKPEIKDKDKEVDKNTIKSSVFLNLKESINGLDVNEVISLLETLSGKKLDTMSSEKCYHFDGQVIDKFSFYIDYCRIDLYVDEDGKFYLN